MLENRIQKDKLCLQLQLLTKIDQRYKCHGCTHVRCAHLYLFREKGHWWPVLVCWHKETGPGPWLLLAFCASLGLIPSRRGADVLPVGNRQGDTGQDQFLPTPGMGFAVSEGAQQHLTWQGWGRQRVPLLRCSPGDAKEEAVTLETAAALPGTRAS